MHFNQQLKPWHSSTHNKIKVLTWADWGTAMGTRYEQMRRWTSSSRRFGTDSWSDLLISSAPSSVNPHQLLFFKDITCRSPVLLDNLIISRHQVRDRRDRIGDECPVGYLCTRRFVLHGKSAWLFCVILRALWSNYWPHIEGRERSIAPNQRHSAPTPLSCPLIAIACYLSSDLHTTQPSPVPLFLLLLLLLLCFLNTY